MTALIPAKPPGAFLRHTGSLSGAESQRNTQTHQGKWTGGRHVNERTGGIVPREERVQMFRPFTLLKVVVPQNKSTPLLSCKCKSIS